MRRYWIEVFTSNGPLLGSDGTIPLDGRIGLPRAHKEAEEYCRKLQKIKPWVTGWVISAGSKPSILTPISLPQFI